MAKRQTKPAATPASRKKGEGEVELTALVNVPRSMTGGARVAKGDKFKVPATDAERLKKIKYAK